MHLVRWFMLLVLVWFVKTKLNSQLKSELQQFYRGNTKRNRSVLGRRERTQFVEPDWEDWSPVDSGLEPVWTPTGQGSLVS